MRWRQQEPNIQEPIIKVIKIKEDTRDVEIEEYTNYGYSHSTRKTKKIKKSPFTTVLYTKDGELYTREFNGEWDLEDIKHWEEA